MNGELMTRGERADLAKVVRLRARVARNDVDVLAAQHLAKVEAQLATRYDSNHEAWAEVTREAKKAVAAADALIAEKCKAMGLVPSFRPGICVSWYDRGENADKNRRAELRRVAESEIDARAKAAKREIDRHEAQQLTALTAGGLTSAEARAFLESMPSIDDLLPAIAIVALEEKIAPKVTP